MALLVDGNCFFISLAYTAGLPLSHQDLRQEICTYLRTFPNVFAQWRDTYFKSYEDYVLNLERDGVYADDLCCMAASHLLLRPLRIISDCSGDYTFDFEPPETIDRSAWGHPVVLAFYLKGRHYEATQLLEADVQAAKRNKREAQS